MIICENRRSYDLINAKGSFKSMWKMKSKDFDYLQTNNQSDRELDFFTVIPVIKVISTKLLTTLERQEGVKEINRYTD